MVRVDTITLGRQVRRAELDGFVLREATHEAEGPLPAHAHDRAGLAVVIDGGFTETYGPRSIEAAPWSVVVRPAEATHSDCIHAGGCRTLVIEFLPGALARLGAARKILAEAGSVTGASIAGSARRLYAEFRANGVYGDLALQGLVLELLAEVGRREHGEVVDGEPHWMLRARGILQTEFSRSLGLSEVAQRVGVHPVHLARAFRERHGTTVGEYVRRLRIDYASRELAGGERPLAHIAKSAGFSDQSHFSRLFRRHTGMTPSQFRKSSRP